MLFSQELAVPDFPSSYFAFYIFDNQRNQVSLHNFDKVFIFTPTRQLHPTLRVYEIRVAHKFG